MISDRRPGPWARAAARIAFGQAALALAFFAFLFVYAATTNHSLDRARAVAYLGALAFVLGVPAAFVAAGLAFRSGARTLTWLGVALEAAWVLFAVWGMASQAADHDVDFLNNLPVYTLLACGGLAAAVMPFLDGRSDAGPTDDPSLNATGA